MKVVLKRITVSDKSKDGKPFITKDGRPYSRIGIQTDVHGAMWLSGFAGEQTKYWKEGDTVHIEVEENGQYLNFKPLSKLDLLEARVEKLEQMMQGTPEMPVVESEEPVDLPF